MPATKQDTTFSLRLLEVDDLLPYGATLTGESKSEFCRRAIRERVERLEREVDDTTTEEEQTDG